MSKIEKLNLFNTTLAWKEGMEEWLPAKEINELKEKNLSSAPSTTKKENYPLTK